MICHLLYFHILGNIADVLLLYLIYSRPNITSIKNSSLLINIINMKYIKHGMVNNNQELKNRIIPGMSRNITSANRGFLHIEKIPFVINSCFL